MAEIFNQERMVRCTKIASAIIDNARRTNSFEYKVRATEVTDGLTFDELRKQYFSVGIGDDLTDVPFTDLLVIFSLVSQDWKAGKGAGQLSVSTEYSDEEAYQLLSQIRIETPFDKDKVLRIVAEDVPPEEDDGQQTPP